MYSDELIRQAQAARIPNFMGVYALDKLPTNIIPQQQQRYFNFVVNTDTYNLLGTHWIAVHVDRHKIYLFDPMGIYYPPLLCKYVIRFGKPIVYNWKQFQPITEKTCGQYCLRWLSTISYK